MQLGKATEYKDVVQNGGMLPEDILQVLHDSCAYLDGLQQFLQVTTSLFRSGDEVKAKEMFVDLVKGLELVIVSANAVTGALNVEFATWLHEGRSLADFVKDFNSILLDMVSAQERKDWVLLADLLEYELAPRLESWQRFFLDLKTRI